MTPSITQNRPQLEGGDVSGARPRHQSQTEISACVFILWCQQSGVCLLPAGSHSFIIQLPSSLISDHYDYPCLQNMAVAAVVSTSDMFLICLDKEDIIAVFIINDQNYFFTRLISTCYAAFDMLNLAAAQV